MGSGQLDLRVSELASQILKSSTKLVDLCFGGREAAVNRATSSWAAR
jgi:hypothetical protein